MIGDAVAVTLLGHHVPGADEVDEGLGGRQFHLLGPGMEAERLEKAHLPCYITREGKGFPKEGLLLGLGLPIVYQLTVALGGKFTLNSAPGEGCRARVELPAEWMK